MIWLSQRVRRGLCRSEIQRKLRVRVTAMRFLALGILSLLTSARCTFTRRTALQETSVPSPALGSVIEHTWHVTVGSQAPDCFQRDVLLVNGEFQPTLEIFQGDILKVGSTPDAAASSTTAVLVVRLVALNSAWCIGVAVDSQCCLWQAVLLLSLSTKAAIHLCGHHPHTKLMCFSTSTL